MRRMGFRPIGADGAPAQRRNFPAARPTPCGGFHIRPRSGCRADKTSDLSASFHSTLAKASTCRRTPGVPANGSPPPGRFCNTTRNASMCDRRNACTTTWFSSIPFQPRNNFAAPARSICFQMSWARFPATPAAMPPTIPGGDRIDSNDRRPGNRQTGTTERVANDRHPAFPKCCAISLPRPEEGTLNLPRVRGGR